MNKHEKLFKKIEDYYDCDNFERDNEKPLNLKLMWLKSNIWRSKKEKYSKPGYCYNEKACDIVIMGCNSPSGDYATYWDIIEDFFDNRPWIWFKSLIDNTTSMLPKRQKKGNELLKYIKEFDCELGGYVDFSMKEIKEEENV